MNRDYAIAFVLDRERFSFGIGLIKLPGHKDLEPVYQIRQNLNGKPFTSMTISNQEAKELQHLLTIKLNQEKQKP